MRDDSAVNMASINDLPAADAIYHQQCSNNFRTLKNISSSVDPGDNAKTLKIGRPEDKRAQAFIEVTHYLENHGDEQKSINELIKNDRVPGRYRVWTI